MHDLIEQLEPLIPALRGYARALLRDPHEADDLVQDCLERAIARWSRRREAASTRSWVFAIAHNLAMDVLRRRQRRGHGPVPEEADQPEARIEAPQEDHMRALELQRAYERLSEEQRSVLYLVTVQDMPYAEVAALLGIPLGTVMSRLSRARARLLAALDDTPRPSTTTAALRRIK